jgi:hypothetical protein
MIKKYQFPTQEAALYELNAVVEQQGFLQIAGAENAVDLGHITLVDAVIEEGEVTKEAVLSEGYCVDVMWRDDPPAHLKDFEVTPQNAKHGFAGE